MNHKFSEIIHSAFSIFALIGVISLSAFVVMHLNPISTVQEAAVIGPSIAGVSTSNQRLNFINIAEESSNYKTELKNIPENINYIANFDNAKAIITDGFLKIQNASENDGAFSIEALIPSALVNKVKIQIEDENDLIYLNNLESKRISVGKNSERTFRIRYSFEEQINYKFNITFKIVN